MLTHRIKKLLHIHWATSTTELLREARQCLVRGGWQKGSLGDINDCDSPHCALGAILAAGVVISGAERAGDAFETLRRVINMGISSWNDAPTRTEAEVLDAFDRAIELSREG